MLFVMLFCLGSNVPSTYSTSIMGDRLVGINGQCVRCPEEAGELLRESGEIVRLQLVRNGVGSQSLPRHGIKLEPEEDTESEMGSNMSRHSGKGLTGRRSQSSGNLCNGKIIGSNVGRFFSPCSRSGVENSVGPRDRYKFCGSLPNHLDAKDPVEIEEIDEDSSFKNNNNVATLNNHHPLKNKQNDAVELRLHPLVSSSFQHVHQDSATNDQGYASERSPEEELPPDLPAPIVSGTCPLHHRTGKAQYPFINKHSTFTVTLVKGSRGLGLSVTGGIDSNEQWPGLIRIKRLFPHQPAWESGQLAQGDILLVANNTPLTGLTNYEALEVLRTTPTDVVLTVCRPPPELQILNVPAPTEPAPIPPRRDTQSSTSSLLLPLKRETYGEFDINLTKVNGSLGFTLRKEDESVLGHYVRALVREPALSDGRIKPGDKIVAVNGVDLSPMSHEEAVTFLRQCGQEVHLRLFRDPAQTPVAALSPTEGHRTFKPILRKEAQDMLSDLAVKKSMSPDESTGSSTLSRLGRSSSPRKRRLTKMPSPDSQINGGSCDELDSSSHIHDKENENTDDFGVGPLPSEPVSMPPLSNSTASLAGFSYRNPAYRSANPATNTKLKSSLLEELPDNRCSDNDLPVGNTVEGSKGLLKWKGVVFTPEDGAPNSANSPEDSISQITETDEAGSQSLQSEGVGQVLVVELNRGWNSRLGFSLQQVGRNSVISAIYPDSVASRDGRLKSGDQLIMVNDESVEGMTTSEVIDLLRKIRGSICITVWRKS